MNHKQIINEIKKYVYNKFKSDTTGHDFQHMQRVAKNAVYLASVENVDPFICEVAGWVHDLIDDKLTDYPEAEKEKLIALLQSLSVKEEKIKHIIESISTVSYRSKKVPTSKIGQIVQDADRLDAIGAIGIARAFSYGGSHNRPIYVEREDLNQSSTIEHFYDKLLLIKDKLHTQAAKELAEERHEFLIAYLNQFKKEWGSLN